MNQRLVTETEYLADQVRAGSGVLRTGIIPLGEVASTRQAGEVTINTWPKRVPVARLGLDDLERFRGSRKVLRGRTPA